MRHLWEGAGYPPRLLYTLLGDCLMKRIAVIGLLLAFGVGCGSSSHLEGSTRWKNHTPDGDLELCLEPGGVAHLVALAVSQGL